MLHILSDLQSSFPAKRQKILLPLPAPSLRRLGSPALPACAGQENAPFSLVSAAKSPASRIPFSPQEKFPSAKRRISLSALRQSNFQAAPVTGRIRPASAAKRCSFPPPFSAMLPRRLGFSQCVPASLPFRGAGLLLRLSSFASLPEVPFPA